MRLLNSRHSKQRSHRKKHKGKSKRDQSVSDDTQAETKIDIRDTKMRNRREQLSQDIGDTETQAS